MFETSAVWYYCEQRQRRGQHKLSDFALLLLSSSSFSSSSSVFLRGYKEANEKKLVDQSIKGVLSIDEGKLWFDRRSQNGGIVSIFSSADLLLSYKAIKVVKPRLWTTQQLTRYRWWYGWYYSFVEHRIRWSQKANSDLTNKKHRHARSRGVSLSVFNEPIFLTSKR